LIQTNDEKVEVIMMTITEVMDLPTICLSFPKLSPNIINRDHILNAIDMYLDGETELLIIEGVDGIGKTTIIAQYAIRYPNNTFSLFIKSTSRWAYDPDVLLRDLANQITWVLYKKELAPDEEVDRSYLRNCFLALQRRAQSRRTSFIFVIDGIQDIPEVNSDIQEQILDLMPFGFSGFKFIISGDANRFSEKAFSKINHRTLPMIAFTLDETRLFLSDLNVNEYIYEIYKTCKGIPEHLTSIKRIVEGGTDIQTLINDMPEKLPDLFEIEWKKVDEKNEKLLQSIGILAYDRKKHTLQNLSRILQVQTDFLETQFSNINFIVINEVSKEVDFVSEVFRKFVAKRLQYLRKIIIDILINDLLTIPNTQDALLLLPGYFSDAERYDDLLNYLSPENFMGIIECSRSMNPLRQQTTLGIDISKRVGRDNDLWRFSAEKSIILGVDQEKALISELEALIALGDYDRALVLAQSAILKEDLLHSLAILAKKKLDKDNLIDHELIEQIRSLYNQIDPSNLGHRGLEIAADLIYTVPDLAIELVEKSSSSSSDEEAVDWAVAKLSVAAAIVGSQNGNDVYEKIRQRINNPKVNNLTAAASLLLGNYDAERVISDSEKFENPLDGLFMLRLWTTQKREREDAAKVVDYAIKLSIKTTEYTPNARHFRQLASPLPYIKEKRLARELISQFDGIKGTLIKFGPSEDFVRLQLTLAQTERKIDLDAANNRILETYLFFINDLEDLSIKASCIARVYTALEVIDPDKELEKQDQFHTLVLNNLNLAIDKLLATTGEHYEVAKPTINALAKKKPDLAIEIAKKLNLQIRRDRAIYDIIISHINQPISGIDFEFLINTITTLNNQELLDDAFLNIFARINMLSIKDIESISKAVLPFISLIDHIESSPIKCNTLGLAYSFISRTNSENYTQLRENIKQKIKLSWDAIDTGWTKIDFGFRTVETLTPISIEEGRIFYEETDKLKQTIDLNDNTIAEIYINCLQLTIRNFIGLLNKNNEMQDDLDHLQFAIDLIPSNAERIKLWGDIASGYLIYNRIDDSRKIVNKFIRPNLSLIYETDKILWSNIIIRTAPVLFYGHHFSAYEEIKKLKAPQKDLALSTICWFIFRKVLITDPYDYHSGRGFNVSNDEVLDILEIISYIDTDSVIYEQIEYLADSITSPRGRDRFTNEQKIEIVRQLKILTEKLPDKKNISHEGYKITALAQIYRISPPTPQEWINLVEATKNISNYSDQAFVLGLISHAMPKKMAEKKKAILEDAHELLENIPALLDKIDRYETIARYSLDIDQSIAKKYINQGIRFAITRDDPKSFSVQRRLIDLAYSAIGPDFASEIASLADDDPAREKAKTNLLERLNIQKIKHEILDQKENINDKKKEENYPKVAWMLLSSLNADRISTLHMESLRSYIEIASKLPMQESYPIFAWVIQNLVKRFNNTDQANSIIRNMFNALMTATELSGRISRCSSDRIKRTVSQVIRTDKENVNIIRAGERDKAILILREWFENEVRDYLKINDPYFCISDLEVLLLLMEVNPSCKVYISTSKKQQIDEKITIPWDETYRSYWKLNLSDQNPPDCDIVIVGGKNNEHPTHDRWWVTKGSGFRIGTSYRSLGIGKDSEISKLSAIEAGEIEIEIDRFLINRIRDHYGERLIYTTFSL
jgi:hypothetical protein